MRRFERFGKTYHLCIRSADDLEALLDLDDALWVATGAPIDTIRADAGFLKYLDLDANGRILCFEVRAAVRLVLEALSKRKNLTDGRSTLEIAHLDPATSAGAGVREAAGKIASRLGAGNAIDLPQIRELRAKAEARPVSEHGVVLPEAAEDPEVRSLLQDVIASVGPAEHPSGKPGVSDTTLDAFLASAEKYLAWREEGRGVRPLGSETERAFDSLQAIEGKIDQFFALSNALQLDGEILERLRAAEEPTVDTADVNQIREVLRRAPIASPAPGAQLPLAAADNPYYQDALREFRENVVLPILGGDPVGLTPVEWAKIRGRFTAFRAWLAAKPATAAASVPEDRLARYVDGPASTAVRALIDHAEETAIVLDDIRLVEKITLYQANLLDFVNNFVSFPYLYDRNRRAMFEMGYLVMDGRHFNLAVRVGDRAAHRAVASNSSMYVLYVRVQSQAGAGLYEVAVPVTAGGIKNLSKGKRGLFRDTDGKEYDACVVDVIENPISVSETIAAPFKRIAKLVTQKIEALTAEAQVRLDTATTEAVAPRPVDSSTAVSQPVAAAAAGGGGIIAGSGVAIAAVGTAVTYFARTITSVSVWRLLAGLGAALGAVIVPMTILALLKLRRRDLSAILEGSGWAINLRMRLTRGQSAFFTQTPHLPLRARRIALKRLVWTVLSILLAGALLLLYFLFLTGI